MISPARSPLRRSAALAFGTVVALSGALLAAAPATALVTDEPTGHAVTGIAGVAIDGTVRFYHDISVTLIDAEEEVVGAPLSSQLNGFYGFLNVPDGDYDLVFQAPEPATWDGYEVVNITVDGEDLDVDDVTIDAFPYLGAGEVKVTGNPMLGETMTATVTPFTLNGQPVELDEISYQWRFSRDVNDYLIDGANGLSVVVPESAVGHDINIVVTGRLEGYSPTSVTASGGIVGAPPKPAAAAPVADSAGLAEYLHSRQIQVNKAVNIGLPSGSLASDGSYATNLRWWGGDSFVDVYAYSSPVHLGTFAVVNGIVQATLTSEMLSTIGSGSHTLVYLGQSSGAVQAVGIDIAAAPAGTGTPALADTGADMAAPLIGGGVLVLLGGALLIARRRTARRSIES